ncbi:MAG: type II secretion system F family protein [Acidobacteriota bacterium]
MLLFIIFLLLLIAGSMFIFNVLPDFQKINMSKRFDDELGAGREAPGLVKIFRLPILMLTDLAMSMKMRKQRERYQNDLLSLGLEKVVSVDQIIALKLTIFFITLIYGFMMLTMLPVFFAFLFPLLGWMYVDIWLKDKIAKRRRDIKKQLPFLLDMLTLSVEAGLEFTAAVNKIVSKMDPSPLREELTVFLRQMQLGMSRKDALKAMSDRLNIQQINSMVASLIQAAEMGSSIGGALRTQSEIMSAERFVDAEKKGAEASQKMLFPMIMFIIPAVMMVILGPLVIQFMYNRGSM